MIKATNFKVAFAHLTSRVKQVLVATLSVTFGISMYIFLNGFMTGVNDIQTELVFSTMSHVRIYNDLPEDRSNLLETDKDQNELVHLRSPRVIQYTQGIKNSDQIIEKMRDVPGIKDMTVQVNENVFFRNGATKVNGLLAGINASKEDEMYETSESIVAGTWRGLDNRGDGIVLGVGLAKKLSLGMGDMVTVSTADGLTRNFEIIGIVETTLGSMDNSKGFVRISVARQLVSKNRSYATDIQINVKDYNDAKQVAGDLSNLVTYKVESWNEANGQLEASSELRDILAITVSLTILLVAGFGIYNIMNMTVNEKIKEIAILKAMGFEGNDVVEIFLVQSVIIGLIGGIVGLIFGFGISVTVNQIPFSLATLDTLPMSFRSHDYLSAFGFGLLTTFIAGYLPAKKASHVDPVEIIRG